MHPTPSQWTQLYKVYNSHKHVFRPPAGDPSPSSLVILVVRQLVQPASAQFVTRNSTEFGCLFDADADEVEDEGDAHRRRAEPMTAETVHKFIKTTKGFMRVGLVGRQIPYPPNPKQYGILFLVIERETKKPMDREK